MRPNGKTHDFLGQLMICTCGFEEHGLFVVFELVSESCNALFAARSGFVRGEEDLDEGFVVLKGVGGNGEAGGEIGGDAAGDGNGRWGGHRGFGGLQRRRSW